MAEEQGAHSGTPYLDFYVELGPGSDGSYPVLVRAPDGEARGTLVFPFDADTLKQQLGAIDVALLRSAVTSRRIPAEQQSVQQFGAALFDALFQGQVRERYEAILERVRGEHKELRLRLGIRSPDLAALPWELLFDRQQGDFVCLLNVSLVRYLELDQPAEPLAVDGPLRILGLVSSPASLIPLDVGAEQKRIEAALAPLISSGRVQLSWLSQPTWRALQDAMRGGPWHIFHFIGHGSFDAAAGEGLLMLEDEQHAAYSLQSSALARLLDNHRHLRLVLLNSCEGARGNAVDIFSSTASTLVRRGIPAVLAMQYEISDAAANELARTFYVALAAGLPVDTAVAEARESITLANDRSLEWATPVLYMRASDGALFSLPVAAGTGQGSAAAPETDAQPTRSPTQLRPRSVLQGHTKQVNSVAFAPDGQSVVSGSGGWWWSDNTVRVWGLGGTRAPTVLPGHRRQVWSVACAPDGSSFASASLDGTVRVWSAADSSPLHVLNLAAPALGAAYAPDGATLAAALKNGAVSLWRAGDGTQLGELRAGDSAANAIAWSPDGQLLATASDDRTVRLWRAGSQSPLSTLAGHTGRVRGIAFAPDGALLASAGDTTVRLWRVADGHLLRVLQGHEWPVWSVVFTPDGSLVLSGSFDTTVRLWRVADGAQVSVGRGHGKPVQAVAVSADGALAASASHDCTVRIWELV